MNDFGFFRTINAIPDGDEVILELTFYNWELEKELKHKFKIPVNIAKLALLEIPKFYQNNISIIRAKIHFNGLVDNYYMNYTIFNANWRL